MFVDNIFYLLLVVALGVFSKEHEEKRDVNRKYDGPFLMYDVLKSVLKLNEARYETLKKLNNLNNIKYLRTSTENGYDFATLLGKFKSIFKFLSFELNPEEHDDNVVYYDVFYDNIYLLTIPIPSKGKGDNVLRTPNQSDSDEELVENMCGKARLRCYMACKEALRISCILKGPCSYGFLKEMRRSCYDECEYRFF